MTTDGFAPTPGRSGSKANNSAKGGGISPVPPVEQLQGGVVSFAAMGESSRNSMPGPPLSSAHSAANSGAESAKVTPHKRKRDEKSDSRSSPPAGAQTGIADYFGKGRGGGDGTEMSSKVVGSGGKSVAKSRRGDSPEKPSASTASAKHEIEALKQQLAQSERKRQESEREVQRLDGMGVEFRNLTEDQAKQSAAKEQLAKRVLEECLVQLATQQRSEVRERLRRAGYRLGHMTISRVGMQVQEVWEEGQAFVDIENRLHEIAEQKDRINSKVKKQKQSAKKRGAGVPPESGSWFDEEIYKSRLAMLKKEEQKQNEMKEALHDEKKLHVRELKRVRDEDESHFGDFQVLNKRYLVLNLLGRGGFSEVFKAFDLQEYREVACKIHRLHSHWNDERKKSYQKHAEREFQIHRHLDHPRVVRLHDVFPIDNNCFCTILEFCGSFDLDYYLKLHKVLPEREAKLIMLQILEGLAYLQGQKQRIIHYDLKPANILFTHDGEAKITDFGLSKIMDEETPNGDGMMELTSQGAGTYWYLPPECFEKSGSQAPRISTKVDVWSAGIIWYQLLYGDRPFGEGMAQEQMYHEKTIHKGASVEFPEKRKDGAPVPKVSAEAKAMIRECLNPHQDSRPNITQVLQSSYFTPAVQLGRANSGLSQGRANLGGTPSRADSPGLPKAGMWNADQVAPRP